MNNLKISALPDEKPVRLVIDLPAPVHRDLLVYAEAMNALHQQSVTPQKLVAPMIEKFMLSDRAFLRWRQKRSGASSS
ncbi:hypothetical protein CFR79_12380 [Komagataeibacter saccharivorans]|uniref:DUF2274 domain-containing protein n=1 Tax=Komagataeibacter saccharivorans TaxID=265959 RepID=UPI000D7CB594|nr:DUF2274 domain-containing protein [Komagataeibacter saccharivorans]PYD49849.1 hypothetical protein CFR79_12380 [Komagataeibacter saccharivorans]GBQ37350.1 hypothetical protein AA0614_0994 [Komagataeibacter saccharivorans NRIC 0614]